MSEELMKWHPFDTAKGYRQKRPQERKAVLVMLAPAPEHGLPMGVAVGYLKYAAGDKSCPQFIVPHIGYACSHVIAWCDCLPDDYSDTTSLYASEQVTQ